MARMRLILGYVIASPVTLLAGLVYLLPFWALGWHRYIGVWTSEKSALGVAPAWMLSDTAPAWLVKRWEGWGGHCVGSAIVLRRHPSDLDHRGKVLLTHELHHVHQMHKLGVLQPLLYALSSLTAVVAGEKAYSANHFEVEARRVAGQIADAQSFTQGFVWAKNGAKK